jgi:hypothetical protein
VKRKTVENSEKVIKSENSTKRTKQVENNPISRSACETKVLVQVKRSIHHSPLPTKENTGTKQPNTAVDAVAAKCDNNVKPWDCPM